MSKSPVSDLLRVEPGSGLVRLVDVDPLTTPGTDEDKAGAEAEVEELGARLAELQGMDLRWPTPELDLDGMRQASAGHDPLRGVGMRHPQPPRRLL